ncbi:MAG: DinB family protein [Acidobacteria bacterium]|nr:DinB family protein [Acidobacteriota bacterium]
MNRRTVLRHAAVLGVFCTVISLAPVLANEQEEKGEMEMETSSEVTAILKNLAEAGDKLMSLAEATPEDKFAWAPTDEVRTISEVYIHAAGVNLLLPSALGAAPPEGLEVTDSPFALLAEWEKNITGKEEVVAKLAESLEYVHHALGSIKDLDTEVTLFGPPAPKRSYFLLLMAHAHEHLGQSIAYARSVGVVPPWSQPLPSDDGGDGDDDDDS